MVEKPTYEELERRVNKLEKDAIVLKRKVTRNKHQAKFMNIISNAAETMEVTEGGVLRIETNSLPKSSRVAINFKDTATSARALFHFNLLSF